MITTVLLIFFAVVIGPDAQRRHERILRNAIAKSGQTMLQAAQEAETDKGQFTRTIQLIEGSHKKLAMQPDEFWRWFAVEIAREFGIPAELETATRLERAARRSTDSDMEMAS